MAIEIERKFLVINDNWRKLVNKYFTLKQGYLIAAKQASVRVRVHGSEAQLNIKSATLGVTRQEFEYPIPLEDANIILSTLCEKPIIEKTRYLVPFGGKIWEIDEFAGDNAGLIVAEIELDDINEPIEKPDWLGKEVSDDPRYYNTCLTQHPYREWK